MWEGFRKNVGKHSERHMGVHHPFNVPNKLQAFKLKFW